MDSEHQRVAPWKNEFLPSLNYWNVTNKSRNLVKIYRTVTRSGTTFVITSGWKRGSTRDPLINTFQIRDGYCVVNEITRS